jgi:hypothetical protein
VKVKVKVKVKVTECGSTEMAPRNVVARSADRWRVPLMGDNGSKVKAEGPEPLDRLGALSSSKRLVEGGRN